MKSSVFLFICLLISSTVHCQIDLSDKDGRLILIITALNDEEIKKKYDKLSIQNIKGIDVIIAKSINIKSIRVTGSNLDKGMTLNANNTNVNNDAFSFDFNPPPTNKRLALYFTDTHGKIRKIDIKVNDKVDKEMSVNDSNDLLRKNPSPPECQTYSYKNDFGILPDDIDDKTIFLVYDFYPANTNIVHQGVLYKVYKDGKEVKTEPVNINKRSLPGYKKMYLKVVNINRFIYDISTSRSVTNFESEPPILFRRLFLGDSTSLTPIIGYFLNVKKGMEPFEDNSTAYDNLIQSLTELNDMLIKIKQKISSIYSECESFPCCKEKWQAVTYTDVMKKILEVKFNIAALRTEYLNYQNDSLQAERKLNKCIEDNKSVRTRISALKTKLNNAPKSEQEKIKAEIEALKKELCVDSAFYEVRLQDLKITLNRYREYVNYKLQLPKDEDIWSQLILIDNIVDKYSNYSTGPVDLKGDELDITIRIKSRPYVISTFNLTQYNDSISIRMPIYRTSYASFSTGSFIGISNNTLRSTKYSWQPEANSGVVSDTSKYLLVQSGRTSLPAGVCALGNYLFRASPNVGLGVSTGVGVTFESQPRMAYFGGASVFLGRKKQFLITLGVIGMNIDRLNGNFQTVYDKRIRYNKSSITDIEYYKEFKTGYFFSITYTPFKVSKRQF